MTYSKLQKKNAKQLKTFLYNYRWNKRDIVEFLFDYYSYLYTYLPDDRPILKNNLEKMSFEKLCEDYHDDVIDFIWEELCAI